MCNAKKPSHLTREAFWSRLSLFKPHGTAILITGSFGEEPALLWLRKQPTKSLKHWIAIDARLALRAKPDSQLGSAQLRALQFGYVVHTTLSPLFGIAQLALGTDWETSDSLVHFRAQASFRDALTKALYTWIATHQLLEMYSTTRVQLEVLKAINLPDNIPVPMLDDSQRWQLDALIRRYPKTTWQELIDCDEFAAQIACKMAIRFGYECNLCQV
jgi:hypothetical protein